MKKGIIQKTILLYLVVIGVITLAILYTNHQSPVKALPKADIPTPTPTVQTAKAAIDTPTPIPYISGEPVKLVIPKVGIDIPVINGVYDAKTKAWTLTSTNVQYATITSLINNQSGNTLLYGHNIPAVLYNTAYLVPGDNLYVYTNNNHILEYTYTSSTIIQPTDTDIFNYRGSARVTLLTCNGWLSNYRRLMYFNFTQVIQ